MQKNTILSNAKTHCEKMQFQHNSNANAKHVKDKRHENASAEKKKLTKMDECLTAQVLVEKQTLIFLYP